MHRRLASLFLVAYLTAGTLGQSTLSQRDRVVGMLMGSLIGDAAGGPVEFKSRDELRRWLPDINAWSADRFLTQLQSGELAAEFKLLAYVDIRDEIAPYGPWTPSSPAGTVTDDTRHKIILMHALRQATTSQRIITQHQLCEAYLNYQRTDEIRSRPNFVPLCIESFREYHAAARWLLGERNLKTSFPPQRLWAGIATCSGQMALLPLAAVYPGEPDAAYRASYAVNFVDVGPAKDICSALVAGLATAMASNHDDVAATWREVIHAMRDTDPYRYADVPFAKRPATEWLDFAFSASERAKGSPRALFEILEREGRAKYFWDAHFTYASALAFLKFCDFKPREAMIVSLAFGHDTDSAAQLVGALAGAVEGTAAFPKHAQRQVAKRLKADYGQDVEEWARVLLQLADRVRHPQPVQFLDDE